MLNLTGCPVAWALDRIGDKWTLLIVRDLLLNDSMRFHELEQSLTGIAPNTLSARLKKLEEHGLVETRRYQAHPPRYEYVLTKMGTALGPVIMSLYKWGEMMREDS